MDRWVYATFKKLMSNPKGHSFFTDSFLDPATN